VRARRCLSGGRSLARRVSGRRVRWRRGEAAAGSGDQLFLAVPPSRRATPLLPSSPPHRSLSLPPSLLSSPPPASPPLPSPSPPPSSPLSAPPPATPSRRPPSLSTAFPGNGRLRTADDVVALGGVAVGRAATPQHSRPRGGALRRLRAARAGAPGAVAAYGQQTVWQQQSMVSRRACARSAAAL